MQDYTLRSQRFIAINQWKVNRHQEQCTAYFPQGYQAKLDTHKNNLRDYPRDLTLLHTKINLWALGFTYNPLPLVGY